MQATLQKNFFFLALVTGLCSLILFLGCNKKTETTPATPAATTQPAAPATPSQPVPSFSAAQKVGLYVFPNKNQTHDQQLIDESDCYNLAEQQSGVNPEMAPPAPPSSGQVQAAEAQAAESAPQAQGGRARGAARGAAGGAMVGAITGNAGRGAAVGATVGTVRGGRQQKQANAASKQQPPVRPEHRSNNNTSSKKLPTINRWATSSGLSLPALTREDTRSNRRLLHCPDSLFYTCALEEW